GSEHSSSSSAAATTRWSGRTSRGPHRVREIGQRDAAGHRGVSRGAGSRRCSRGPASAAWSRARRAASTSTS
ncbi:hypothetical protein ACFPRL_33310, partial [Pseudoclavibacter helvolus]